MRSHVADMIFFVALTASAAAGAESAPDPTIFISASSIAHDMTIADAMEKAGVPDTGPYSLIKQPPFSVTMEYRVRPAEHASIHKINSELFVVLEGSGTMTVGGHLINPRSQGHDMMAKGLEGGTAYKLHKGDILLVPPNTPHAVTEVNEKIAMMSVHIPLAAPDLWPNNTRPYVMPAGAAPAGH